MRPTDHLKSLCAEDWRAATCHAFTDALANGSLPRAKMLGYLEQDHLFVEAFVRLLASAIAKAPTLPDALPGAQFLGLLTGPENTYFQHAIDALGGDSRNPAPPAPETAGFQAIMREAAASGRYEQMLAVLVVAEWSYLEWAQPHAGREAGLPFWFGEWIALHSGPGFAAVVAYLRGQLDTVWSELEEERRKAARAMFTRAVKLERDFFDAAWKGFATR